MRLVLDTNVLISATLWDNSVSHKLLIKLIKDNIKIFITIEILEEYKEAVMRDFKYTKEEVELILNTLLGFLKLTTPIRKINLVKEDPDDNKIIACAVSSNSNFILSYDNHLLKLKEFEGIGIITPEKFLDKYFSQQ